MHGKETPNLGAIRGGPSRGEVELHLGHAVGTITTVDGKRIDIYQYELGNDPSAGRAIGHGVMDVLTLGLWEVVGTPIEGFQGETKKIAITYDASDRETAINQAAPSARPPTQDPVASEPSFDSDS
ncbi:MAG: hypothetical protein MUF52_10855 [Syntrophobacteraceae bacterium]|nr:hypothetical protein [Syntrophobacteraceae bacterium]